MSSSRCVFRYLLCSFSLIILSLVLLHVHHLFFIILSEVHQWYKFFKILLFLRVFLSNRHRCRYRSMYRLRCKHRLRCGLRNRHGCASVNGKQAATRVGGTSSENHL